jgi:hypothetical protein
LTPDPPVKAPDAKFMEQPWALHPYQYVEQNPIEYWDPDGRDKKGLPGSIKIKLIETKGWEYKDTNSTGWEYKVDAGKSSLTFQADATRVGISYSGSVASESLQAPDKYANARVSVSALKTSAGARIDVNTGTVEATVGASFAEGTAGVTVAGVDTDVTLRAGVQVGVKLGGGGMKVDAGFFSFSIGLHQGPTATAPKIDLPTPPEEVSMRFSSVAYEDPPPPPR